jgi:hypothetical protein
MMDVVQSLELPHLQMLAGVLLVITGCLGLAISRKKAAQIDDEPLKEPNPEPPRQMPPLPNLLDSRRKAAGKQPDLPDE